MSLCLKPHPHLGYLLDKSWVHSGLHSMSDAWMPVTDTGPFLIMPVAGSAGSQWHYGLKDHPPDVPLPQPPPHHPLHHQQHPSHPSHPSQPAHPTHPSQHPFQQHHPPHHMNHMYPHPHPHPPSTPDSQFLPYDQSSLQMYGSSDRGRPGPGTAAQPTGGKSAHSPSPCLPLPFYLNQTKS